MSTYGITGGIGSGKSFVCRMLEERGYKVFYCDAEAKRLIREDSIVRNKLQELVGKELYAEDGTLQKAILSAFICKSRKQADAVDAIVHPRVRKSFLAWEAEQLKAGEKNLYMECALLFEAGFDELVEKTVFVNSDEDKRLEHLMQRDGISMAKARQWMELQMPEAEKRQRADIVINNDYTRLPDISAII